MAQLAGSNSPLLEKDREFSNLDGATSERANQEELSGRQEKPDTLGDSPRWYIVLLSICAFVIGFSIVGSFFFVPDIEEKVVDKDAIEAEVLAEAEANPAEEIAQVFTKEDAVRLSDKAFDLATQIAEHQSAYRASQAGTAEREAEELSLTELLSGSPKQAVGWYIPRDDVVFTWYTYTPYIFEQPAGKSNAQPKPRVLWLAKDPQGETLAWAMGTYDEEDNTFEDVTHGQTQYGATLMPEMGLTAGSDEASAEAAGDGDGNGTEAEGTATEQGEVDSAPASATDADGNQLNSEQRRVLSLFEILEQSNEQTFNQPLTPEEEAAGRAETLAIQQAYRDSVFGSTSQ